MQVVINPTKQYDGLGKLRIGTKKSELVHFVVLLTNPEWSIVRIKTKRLFTFVQYKDTAMVPVSIQLFIFAGDTVEWEGTPFPDGQLLQL